MADEDVDREALGDAGHEARECMACRGTGQVISNLGGTAKTVTCPWCEGSGARIPGIDAQARWLAEREATGDRAVQAPADDAADAAAAGQATDQG